MEGFKYAIFDMDGTLIDSVKIWKNIGNDYLLKLGIKPHAELDQEMAKMSMVESVEYIRGKYQLKGTTDTIVESLYATIDYAYRQEVQLKAGVLEYIEKLKKLGVKICVATASSKKLAKLALGRLGVMEYLEFIMDCQESGVGKHQPDIYLMATEKLGGTVNETMVFEDSGYAIKTAKKAGFYTIGVYDEAEKENREELEAVCDRYVEQLSQLS